MTKVEAKMKNPALNSQEVTFSMVLPNQAFISNFSMEINGREYVADVMEKEEARITYNKAKNRGKGTGLVFKKNDANEFSITTNIEAGSRATFYLDYEEFLERNDNKYQHNIMISDTDVEDLQVEVHISESLPLTNVYVPEIIKDNEIDSVLNSGQNQDTEIDWTQGSKEATIKYHPGQVTRGQLSIEYDVDRKNQTSEIQVLDGYFVHFFTPDSLPTLPKHIVFVLDISGSMYGEKIVQLKDAMFTILEDMSDDDYFSILTFNHGVNKWIFPQNNNKDFKEILPNGVFKVTDHNRNEAIKYVTNLKESGSTNINQAILDGLELLTSTARSETLPENVKPMLFFLTDGTPTTGVTSSNQIKENVKRKNVANIPIISIAFGEDADFALMKEISEETDSLARRIYDGSAAAIQLEEFYSIVSSPVLNNVHFSYVGADIVTDADTNNLYKGGEYVVVGKMNTDEASDLIANVKGDNSEGRGQFQESLTLCVAPLKSSRNTRPFCTDPPPAPYRTDAQSFLKRLFAFKTIKQLMKDSSKGSKNEAKQIALENNFVTDLTSLVVTKNENIIKPIVAPYDNIGYQHKDMYGIAAPTSLSIAGFNFAGRARGGKGRSRGRSPYTNKSSKIKMSLNTPWKYNHFAAGPTSGSFSFENYIHNSRSSPTTTTMSSSTEFSESSSSSKGCKLIMYRRTYFRGPAVEVTEDVDDLDSLNFSNKLVSLKIQGDCDWLIFSDTNFTGISKRFSGGSSYSSVTDIGDLLKNANSIRKV